MGQPSIGVINDLGTSGRARVMPAAAEEPAPPSDVPILSLQGDDWLAGTPVEVDQADKFGWQSADFIRPFAFDLCAVTRVRFPVSEAAPGWREHDYRLELTNGDVLYGEILSIGNDHVLFRSSLAGEVRVRCTGVRCLERCKSDGLVYLGPNGLVEWQVSPGQASWQDQENQLSTDKDGASIYRKIELPPRAFIEFDVSSLFPPVFRLSLGVGDAPGARPGGFRLEVVDQDVIAVYETEHDIDVARVMTLSAGSDRDHVHLRVVLDQSEQRAEVFSPAGVSLATVQVKVDAPRVLPGVLLEHKRGGLCLERLRICSGSGPLSPAATQPELHRVDGAVVRGAIAGYDADRREFMITTEQGPVSCSDEQVSRVFFGNPAAEAETTPLRVSCVDGTRLSGWFAGIDGERLAIDSRAINSAPLASPSVPVVALANLVFSYEAPADLPSRPLLLRCDGCRLHGRLSPGRAEPGQNAVSWLPSGSGVASPLRDDVSATITAQSLARFGSTRGAGNLGTDAKEPIFNRALTRPVPQPQGVERPGPNATVEHGNGPASEHDTIYLATGDTFRCHVTHIDDRGVTCRTASAEKRIAHGSVKAINLSRVAWSRPVQEHPQNPQAGAAPNHVALDREKISRLLTLPRLNRDDPPTHVLCAANGDCLRGRLLELSDETLRFALGEAERQFPRERIAAIIWLHPQVPGEAADRATADRATAEQGTAEQDVEKRVPPNNRAYAVTSDGTRLTFAVREIDEFVIAGVNEVLGDCNLPLDRLNTLLLGERALQASTQLAYHDWLLTPAPDPLAFQENGQPADAGAASPLVGQLAPDFELDLLDGSKFRLSQQRGRGVVLDFWASWCAPCVAGLPKLVRTVDRLPQSEVKLVTVNLRQSSDEAREALKRLGLDVATALDRDGSVAARYGATAIPYTVVIGADGRVLRVFIGGGKAMETQLETLFKPMADAAPGPAGAAGAAAPLP